MSLLLACRGMGIMMTTPESIWSSPSLDSGAPWRLRSDSLHVGGVQNPHVPPAVGLVMPGQNGMSLAQTTPTGATAWLEGGQLGPQFSTDDGRLWRFPASPKLFRVGSHVDFVNGRDGWCLFLEGGGLWHTTDGGLRWSALR
jgi:photosystem II stability/assembly factor-like uncharacterized protein